jgi:hypothetical protein
MDQGIESHVLAKAVRKNISMGIASENHNFIWTIELLYDMDLQP